MAEFPNKRKDYSIQPPKQSVANGLFTVTDSANIDFTLALENLTADLTLTGVTPGTYGTATDVPVVTVDQWGRITGVTLIPISGGGGGILTLDNGLTLTGTNGQLGGSLIQDTTIANAAFNLKLTGNPTTDPSFNSIFTIEATGSGSGRSMIKLIGSGTHGVYLDDSLSGIYGTTTSAAVTILGSGSGDTHNFTPATAFIAPTIKTFNRVFASGTAVNGDYVEIYVRLSDPAIPGSTQTWYIDRLEYTDIVAGTAKYVKKIGSFVKASFNAHEIDHLGQHRLNEYGDGSFTGTAAYYAAWDADGNFIEEPIPGGGGSVAWGAITGTLSDQTDLQSALDLKANLSGATFTGLLEANAGYDFNGTGTQPSEITHSGSGDLNIAHSGSGDIVISKSGSGTILQDGTEFQEDITVPDEVYGPSWNGSLEAPTKNALYDKIETLTPVPDIAIYPYQQAVMIIDSNPLTLSAFPSINIVAAPSVGAGNVKLFDAITNEPLITLTVPRAVAAFHIPSINEIWISTSSANTIRRYNDSTFFSFIATFANGGNRATEAVIDPVSGYVYTTNLTSNSISVIDPTGPSVVTTFASGTIGGTSPKGICYNNNPASAMYQMIVAVLSGTNELCVIDPSTNTVTAININPSGSLSGAQSIAYSETSDQYYIACSIGENVVVLEPLTATTMGLVTSIQGIINAYDIECDQDTGLLYVSFARIQASVVVSHVLLGVIDSSLNRLVRVCNTASINTSTTVVYNVAVDSVNGVAYCNGYTGSNSNKFLSKFKIKP